MRLDVNISMLFTELPFIERPRAAADVGFDAIESWWPFEAAVPPTSEVHAFVRAVDRAGVRLECLNLYGGDFQGGDRGLLSLPSRVEQFRANLPVALKIAQSLGCRRLNALYGNLLDRWTPEAQAQVAIDNLATAIDAATAVGATVLLEPLNRVDFPRYGLHEAGDVVHVSRLVHGTSDPMPLLLFDAYHVAMNGHDPAPEVAVFAEFIGHVQVADVPGRGQPGTGAVDFQRFFETLASTGYEGSVGLEYRAASSSGAFAWLDAPWAPRVVGPAGTRHGTGDDPSGHSAR